MDLTAPLLQHPPLRVCHSDVCREELAETKAALTDAVRCTIGFHVVVPVDFRSSSFLHPRLPKPCTQPLFFNPPLHFFPYPAPISTPASLQTGVDDAEAAASLDNLSAEQLKVAPSTRHTHTHTHIHTLSLSLSSPPSLCCSDCCVVSCNLPNDQPGWCVRACAHAMQRVVTALRARVSKQRLHGKQQADAAEALQRQLFKAQCKVRCPCSSA